MGTILKRTPLFEAHAALNAKFTDFAGWEMPLQYKGILEEHRAVRSSFGVFDVSHMGRLEVKGEDARALLDRTITSSIASLPLGKARYGLMCREDGGILDDVVVFSLEPDRLLLVCNASNRIAVYQWVTAWVKELGLLRVDVDDLTEATAMIAWQGPRVTGEVDILYQQANASQMSYYSCVELHLPFGDVLVSRTGYTGEDGVELILSGERSALVWEAILATGTTPCGLGARDTLRLEAGMPLYGQDMDLSTNPLEAGLDRFVALNKPDFVGKEALVKAKAAGLSRRLVGFIISERGIPRHGCPIIVGGKQVGWVTSGGYGPTLDKGIGLGYVPIANSVPGSRLEIDVRGKLLQAEVVKLPFYKRIAKAGKAA